MTKIEKPKANKNLGQHYLNNKETIKSICHDFMGEYDQIIEIGPGPATLTTDLVTLGRPLTLIEKDDRFLDLLNELSPAPKIFNEDALEFNGENYLSKNTKDKIWLVSNLPYNVGTPIMLKFMKFDAIRFMTLMFQKEVAQKIYLPLFGEKKYAKEMNSLHVLVNNYFEISLLRKVPPGQFSPPPKVDSAVVSLRRRENPTISLSEWTKFEQFLRNLFSNRRKQLTTVLKNYYEKKHLTNTLDSLNIAPTLRAETLTFDQVISLFKTLHY